MFNNAFKASLVATALFFCSQLVAGCDQVNFFLFQSGKTTLIGQGRAGLKTDPSRPDKYGNPAIDIKVALDQSQSPDFQPFVFESPILEILKPSELKAELVCKEKLALTFEDDQEVLYTVVVELTDRAQQTLVRVVLYPLAPESFRYVPRPAPVQRKPRPVIAPPTPAPIPPSLCPPTVLGTPAAKTFNGSPLAACVPPPASVSESALDFKMPPIPKEAIQTTPRPPMSRAARRGRPGRHKIAPQARRRVAPPRCVTHPW